jgi:septum site-determining protein MinD
VRVIGFSSGKGGVGKSTITLNLGLLLAQAGHKVVVVDADVHMANLGVLLGVESNPITLHNVLKGENNIRDAVYEGPFGVKYVPSSLSMDKHGLEFSKLGEVVKELTEYDFVLVDCPPGVGEDAEAALKASQELVIVLTPEPSSLADALKTKAIAEHEGTNIIGTVLNMSLGEKTEVQPGDLSTVMELPVLAVLPEDVEVRRSAATQKPVVMRAPSSKFVSGIHMLAAKLLGKKVAPKPKARKGLLSSIFSFFARVFGRN